MTKTTEITVTADADQDDCLTAAADAYVADHPEAAGWDLLPRWADENDREVVVLTVPVAENNAETETVQYRIDADMLGDGFAGTTGDLRDFVPHLAAATGRPQTDFLIQQHVTQWEGAEEPSDEEWQRAVEAFAAERPDLFPESW